MTKLVAVMHIATAHTSVPSHAFYNEMLEAIKEYNMSTTKHLAQLEGNAIIMHIPHSFLHNIYRDHFAN